MGQYIGPVLIGIYGIWMLLFTGSYLRVQKVLSRPDAELPKPLVIRLLGGVVVFLAVLLHLKLRA
jgi:hypothetical protein